MKTLDKIYSIFSSFLFKFFIFLQLFLFLRLLLKFLGANPETPVVSTIYKGSDIFIAPFNMIFDDIYLGNFLIEISTLCAMIGYAVVMFFIVRLLRLRCREY